MYADRVENSNSNSNAPGVGNNLLKSAGLLKHKGKRGRGVGSTNEDSSMSDADSSSRRSQIRNKSNPLARPSTSSRLSGAPSRPNTPTRPKKVSLNNPPTKPTSDRNVIDALTRFLNTRFDSNLNFLNLEKMGDDDILKSANFIPPGYSKQKSLAGPSLFKLIAELFPDVKTISLASNHLRNLHSYKSLPEFIPNLENLSLSDNDFRHVEDLYALCSSRRLRNLKELILSNNPISRFGDTWRARVIKKFPTLELLDMKPVQRSVTFDLGDGVKLDPKKQRIQSDATKSLPSQFPVAILGSFGRDNAEVGPLVAEFLTRFFSLFDNDRGALLPAYTDTATFSISVNTNTPPRARRQNLYDGKPKIMWKPYIDNKPTATSRNCSKIYNNETRNQKLSVGNKMIIEAQKLLPRTTHNISDINNFVFDCWTMPGVIPSTAVIFCSVHGEFIENGNKGFRSFDRTFILAPSSVSTLAAESGWPCAVVSDSLTLRALSKSEAWREGSTIDTVEGSKGILLKLPKNPPDHISKEQHGIVCELAVRTRLNYDFSIECLQSNNWNLEQALNNFEATEMTNSSSSGQENTSVVLVTGGTGLVGSAINKVINEEAIGSRFGRKPNESWVFLKSTDGDLRNYAEARAVFAKYSPTHVIHLAAKVGGLFANMKYKLDFLRENMLINDNVLHLSHEFKVHKLISCLSTCVFPDQVSYPLREESVHLGPPHSSNFGYAYGKRMIDVQNHAYNDQFGNQFTSAIPTNIFGPNDNYSLEYAHVIPALIHKCYLANKEKKPFVVMGSGKPLRQFIYSLDLARLFIWQLREYHSIEPVILSVGENEEVSIKEVADAVVKAVGFQGEYVLDTSKPDGQYRKPASNDKLMRCIGNFQFTPFEKALEESVDWADNEDLIDYEEEEVAPQQQQEQQPAQPTEEGKDKKGSYVGIHSTGFRDFLLKPELLRAISDLGFEHPSEVQQECIPQAILGMDVVCQAKSGMGKTAVFVLASLQQLEPVDGEVSVIVLCHTRELAYQIKNEYGRFSKYVPNVRTSVFFGGTPVAADQEILKNKEKCPHVIVGTPGRINALVRDGSLNGKAIKHFVLDECDKMLDQLDMRRDVQEIFKATPHHKQVMMFSATLSKEIRPVCKKFMQSPLEIYVDDETKLTLHGLQQHYVKLSESTKNRKLNDLLDSLDFNQVVIFVKSTLRANELDKLLRECNFPSICIHSRMSQDERIARGIDVERVNIVVNYDTPTDADSYLHRPYFFNSETRESVWEAPGNLTQEEIKSLAGYELLAGGAGGAGEAPQKVRASHLLIKHNKSRRPSSWKEANITRSKEEALAQLRELQSTLSQYHAHELAAVFSKLAHEHSDCSSHAKGGDLGRFSRGQMQKPFEDASFNIGVLQLSDIIDTDSGVHLILRLE
ncbi:hypothetical protein E3P94_01590 [Wallemia ichthyophaga]|nr:hypothetical protein E3P95_01458 [Wallemia ichthyophaga]TIB01863.1 hypothetical protein E3P94_01590 [Wallemia ichthyophaga]